MKLETTVSTLLGPVLSASGPTKGKQTLPMLGHLLIQHDGSVITLTGTDLQTQVTATAMLSAWCDDGAICLPAQKLGDILRLAQADSTIKIDIEGDSAIVRVGKSRYKLGTLPAGNFPSFDASDAQISAELSADVLLRAITRVQYAMAQNDVRYYLNGIAITLTTDTLEVVASDGHRLVRQRQALPQQIDAPIPTRIVPREAVSELAKLLADAAKTSKPCTLTIGERTLGVSMGNVTFATKLVDGKYPDINRVIPTEFVGGITADASELVAAIQRVIVLADSPNKSLMMSLGEEMKLSGVNSSNEEAAETLYISTDGQPLDLGFNGEYLKDALSPLKAGTVKFDYNERAAMITDPEDSGYCAVVMPMRL